MPIVVNSNRPGVVRISRATSAQVTERRTRTATVQDARTASTVQADTNTVQVSSPGPRGLPGADGLNGAGLLPPIAVAWGNASPRVVHTVGADAYVDLVQIALQTGFNGDGPSIAVGIDGEPEALMPASYIAPATPGTYEASPDRLLVAGTNIIVTLNPGAGGSAGAGQLFLSLIPTS